MKVIQTYLSALIDLFFPRFDPENPKKEIPRRPWLELIGISLVIILIITLMASTMR